VEPPIYWLNVLWDERAENHSGIILQRAW